MSMRHSDVVAAVCCHSGALLTPADDDDNGDLHTPVPTWLVHGKLDNMVPYFGLYLPGIFGGTLENMVEDLGNAKDTSTADVEDETLDDVDNSVEGLMFPSVQAGYEELRRLNGCERSETVEEDFDTFGFGTRQTGRGCRNNATVELVSLNRVMHMPFMTMGRGVVKAFTNESIGYDTTADAWKFCSSNEKKEAPVY